MTKRLRDDHEEEYRRIPWIWRVAIAAGRRDRPSEQRRVLDVALPADDGKLDDWRAVVIGGGLINGVSLNGTWPRDRFEELLREDESLRARWNRALELASTMADDEKIPTGTRYDALRMLGVEPWERRGEQIAKYLAKDTHPELQMGAVSALADVRHPEATTALVNAYEGLEAGNRPLAIDALLRDDDRAARLLDAIAAKRIPVDDLGPERSAKLRTHENAMIRQKAIETLDAKKE
jgi:hypothetical protein